MWHVLADTERAQWEYRPSVAVGPLRFGMSPDEVTAALPGLQGAIEVANRGYHDTRKIELRTPGPHQFRATLTAYFTGADGLFTVVPDAQFGPQVTLDGIRLVARVPSALQTELLDHAKERGIIARLAPEGDIELADLGITMRVQRAGDVVLSRPVLAVVRSDAYTLWDGMPTDELQVH